MVYVRRSIMKLKEVFSIEFIDKLNRINDGANLDPDLEVNGFIDIKDILKALNFEVEFEDNMVGSGKINGNRIIIDGSENSARQRFSMAHELGHAVQNDRNANRNDDSEDYSSEERRKEVFANTFAAQFLMPKVLVKEAINESITQNDFDRLKLTPSNIDTIVSEVSVKLGVSKIAMKYRIENLNIFIPAKEQ